MVKIGRGERCRIKTGTYTGDGTTSQPITSVGFKPKYVKIWVHTEVLATSPFFEKTDTMPAALCATHPAAAAHMIAVPNAIISLDADGFTVDDSGADVDPNKNGVTYDYKAMG